MLIRIILPNWVGVKLACGSFKKYMYLMFFLIVLVTFLRGNYFVAEH